jgi:hypothetical protein
LFKSQLGWARREAPQQNGGVNPQLCAALFDYFLFLTGFKPVATVFPDENAYDGYS